MIRCKRVYDLPSQEDGYRVFVDRLWPRGVKKTDLPFDEWAKELTPSNALRMALHHENVDFAEFSRCYLAELANHHQAVQALAQRSRIMPITLLYAAKNTTQNHALILASYIRLAV